MLKYLSILLIVIMTQCVPTQQFQELKTKNNSTVSERDSLKNVNEELTVSYTEAEAKLKQLENSLGKSEKSNSDFKDTIQNYKKLYKTYKVMYDKSAQRQNLSGEMQDEETVKLLAELQITRSDLIMQEDELRELDKNLIQKELELDQRNAILMSLEEALNKKSKRVHELESILGSRDSAAVALKEKVINALRGFENKGLRVKQKHGKVYVIMDEELLFKSGKWDVDPKGQQAINKLGKVLETNTDIEITVEGHTDNVPMNSSGDIKDNWDLSVKRATSITKTLLSNSKIEPVRVTAAGKGSYMPIDNSNTSAAKAKNRRSEIILSPKLDEIFEIIESY